MSWRSKETTLIRQKKPLTILDPLQKSSEAKKDLGVFNALHRSLLSEGHCNCSSDEHESFLCGHYTSNILLVPFHLLIVERRRNLLKKSLRKDLFYLFAGWSGKFGYPFESSQSSQHHHQQHPHHNQHHHQSGSSGGKSFTGEDNNPNSSSSPIVSTTEFEFSALQVREALGWQRVIFMRC